MIDGRRPAPADPLDEQLFDLVAGGRGEVGSEGGGPPRPVTAPRVVDVGGGSGTRAVPLARRGCRVIVVDASVDALAILHRRAADAGVAELVVGRQADAHQLGSVVPDGTADLVLCHHLLEEVDDPTATLTAIVAAVRPGGWVSVVATGRWGAVVAHTIAGRFADAATLLADPDGRIPPSDPLRRRYDPDELAELLAASGLQVAAVTGIGGAVGLVAGAVRQALPSGDADLARLDAAFGADSVLRRLAPEVHIVARRPTMTDS